MSIIVGDGGQLEVGPDDGDPCRRANARIVRDLAFFFEDSLQMLECHDIRIEQLLGRVKALETTVAMLEQLLIGRAA